MKHLIQYIKEEIDENIFYMLDKWFETNEDEKQVFIELIAQCKGNTIISVDKIAETIKGTSFEKNLKQFVNFLDNDIKQDSTEKDYIYLLKKILEITCSNKSYENTYKQYVE